MTTDVDAVQEHVLAEILGRNAESEYLTKCGLAWPHQLWHVGR